MVGGINIARRAWRLVGALGVLGAASATASAADLGGNCCADLEERIAELEATTARKGNRKVSLEVYGQVNEAVLFWDDGGESNVYQVTNDNARTRIGFRGKAKIDSDWEAGYRIEIGIRTANSKRSNQGNDEGDGNPQDVGLDIRDSYWYLKSKSLGSLSVGQQASATDAITESNLTQTKDFSKYSDVEDTGFGFFLRSANNGRLTNNTVVAAGDPLSSPGDNGITWRRLIGDGGDQPGEGERRYNLIKYETPAFAGFSASASWGEDDFWDIALRYSGEIAGFKLAAGVGYGEQRDGFFLDTKTVCAGRRDGAPSSDQQCDQFGGSFSIVHDATGLFLNAAAGVKSDDLLAHQARFAGTGVDTTQEFWSIQAGIEKKFNDFGKTTIYGEYYDYDGGGNSRRTVDGPDGGVADALNVFGAGGDSAIWGTGVQVLGAGIAQGFDKAGLVVYLSYRHAEADLTVRQLNGGGVALGAIADSPVEDLDLVMTGAVLKF